MVVVVVVVVGAMVVVMVIVESLVKMVSVVVKVVVVVVKRMKLIRGTWTGVGRRAKATAGGIAPSARQFRTRLGRLCGKCMSTPRSATWGAQVNREGRGASRRVGFIETRGISMR